MIELTETSTVIVKNIWMEDLFKWFYEHIMESGGDGAAVIVCKNYKETSDMFIEWWKDNRLQKIKDNYLRMTGEARTHNEFFHERDEYDNIVNYHNNNENFMFSDTYIEGHFHDYTFLVEEDCRSCENSEKLGINKVVKDWK